MKKWIANIPEECDICKRELKSEDFFVDGKTKFGPWGIMCPACHLQAGVGLGIGKGQKYSTETSEKIGG